MTDDTRIPITIAFEDEAYRQLCTIAGERGITLQALLDEIIDLELRRLRQEARTHH